MHTDVMQIIYFANAIFINRRLGYISKLAYSEKIYIMQKVIPLIMCFYLFVWFYNLLNFPLKCRIVFNGLFQLMNTLFCVCACFAFLFRLYWLLLLLGHQSKLGRELSQAQLLTQEMVSRTSFLLWVDLSVLKRNVYI